MSDPNGGRAPMAAAESIFGTAAAIGVAFFAGPPIYHHTIDLVQNYALHNYGFQGEVISYFWAFMIAVGSYGLSKLLLSIVLKLLLFQSGQWRGR